MLAKKKTCKFPLYLFREVLVSVIVFVCLFCISINRQKKKNKKNTNINKLNAYESKK